MLEHHHFTPKDLLTLEWSPVVDMTIERDNNSRSERYGYHEATFSIGADEIGHIMIPDSALAMLQALP